LGNPKPETDSWIVQHRRELDPDSIDLRAALARNESRKGRRGFRGLAKGLGDGGRRIDGVLATTAEANSRPSVECRGFDLAGGKKNERGEILAVSEIRN
jgi:hypothetical protein